MHDDCIAVIQFPELTKELGTICETELDTNALLYLAEYVVYRIRSKYSFLNNNFKKFDKIDETLNWITFISKGNLSYPHENFFSIIIVAEDMFQKFHGIKIK